MIRTPSVPVPAPLNGDVADDYFVRRQVGGDVHDDAGSPGVEDGCQRPIAIKGDGFAEC